MITRRVLMASFAALVMVTPRAGADIIVHTSDFIADTSRTHFNGFESMPVVNNFYTGGNGPYVEDGIQVQQVNGDGPNSIGANWCQQWGGEGNWAWYPNAGDFGYTEITMADGSDFVNVGFLRGSSGGSIRLNYELLHHGVEVLSGYVSHTNSAQYLGFSGGGFDEIRVQSPYGYDGGYVGDGMWQDLAVDSIETSVPEPGSIALLAAGAIAAWVCRRRKAC